MVVSEPAYVMGMTKKDASFVLIDMRSRKETKKGHIKGAVSIPAESLEASRQMFPTDMTAPIILYSGNSTDANSFTTVRKWGYKNVSAMNGGIGAWKKTKGKLSAGEAASRIVYVKRIPKNEVGIEEFRAIVTTRPADKVILDVRNSDTTSQGTIAGAVTIPLDELDARITELPTDKEIVIHCNTGIMAGMAQKTLDEKGYKSRILNAVVQVDSDGTYEVSEK
jgi:rhodanese-related sulfurtransferase